MGFGLTRGGLSAEELLEQAPLQIGTGQVGIIIHAESGTAKDGTNINESLWVEIYAPRIHFSEV